MSLRDTLCDIRYHFLSSSLYICHPPAPPSVSVMANFCVSVERHITQVKHQSRCCYDLKNYCYAVDR